MIMLQIWCHNGPLLFICWDKTPKTCSSASATFSWLVSCLNLQTYLPCAFLSQLQLLQAWPIGFLVNEVLLSSVKASWRPVKRYLKWLCGFLLRRLFRHLWSLLTPGPFQDFQIAHIAWKLRKVESKVCKTTWNVLINITRFNVVS